MNKVRHNLNEIQFIAASRNGSCLSKVYISYESKLKFQCDKSHEWEATPATILRGSWCPKCAGHTLLTIDEMHSLAKIKGGKCLTTEYINNTTKLRWQCDKGHEWDAVPKSIKRGIWCPTCALKKPSMAKLKLLATKRGGRCLSESFTDHKSKLRWQCDKGHEWETRLSVIESGSWCPVCSGGMGEHICRIFFEKLFNTKFNKARPIWLNSETGTRLELDGYNQDINVAFEHQGLQHYEQVDRFHKINDLKTLQERDKIKVIKCREQGVNLFVIPSIPDLLELEKLESYIRHEARRLQVVVPNTKSIDVNNIDRYTRQDKLIELQDIARSKGGKCLSSEYISSRIKLKWQCDKGHQWEASPASINKGSWCQICVYIKRRLTIEGLQRIAQNKGGQLLSTEYVNSTTKLKWQCDKGHQWEVSANGIRNGNWCKECAGLRQLTIEEMRDIAAQRGGKCLSIKYVNSKSKLKWQCTKGHEWEMTPTSVKNQNQWCPYCAHRVILTIEEMQDIALSRGGVCLSEIYTNSATKLEWQCEKGHIWKAAPRDIKSGHWCPNCAGHTLLTIEEMQDIALSRGGVCLSEIYTNSATKLEWQCEKGHIWKAAPGAVRSGNWCQRCYAVSHKSNIELS